MANSKSADGALLSGEKAVASAGTAEALGTGIYHSLTIIAKSDNTGQVYVGGSDVASSTNDGLDSLDVITFTSEKGIDLAKVYIDSGTSGDGVDFYAAMK
jgi:hypothetical protein